jgi:hypothetical protein
VFWAWSYTNGKLGLRFPSWTSREVQKIDSGRRVRSSSYSIHRCKIILCSVVNLKFSEAFRACSFNSGIVSDSDEVARDGRGLGGERRRFSAAVDTVTTHHIPTCPHRELSSVAAVIQLVSMMRLRESLSRACRFLYVETLR